MKKVRQFFVKLETTIEQTIEVIQKGGEGICLIIDNKKRLICPVTDGDIRRAILKKVPLNSPVSKLLELRSYPQPTVAPAGTPHDELLKIMREKMLRHIPLLDKQGRVVELVWISELLKEELDLPMSAVVMAGGKGERLVPLTKKIPKPMLPLEDRPVMERIIGQLRKSGIKKVDITTNYKSDVIKNYFGNGASFGVDINYIDEDQPLGTAGSLGLLESPQQPILVINGDVLTQLNFRAMYDFHKAHDAVMTVGVRKCEFKVPYGVVELNHDVEITEILEKPIQTFIVNAGIYLLEPNVFKYIPPGQPYQMPDLVDRLIKEKQKVISFPIQEYWLDIGHPEDYKQAKEDASHGKI